VESINVRWGESFDLAVGTDDVSATEATLIVGEMGEQPILTLGASLTLGVGQFIASAEEMELPLGTYSYQLNVLHSDGQLEKYPQPEDCVDGKLPIFKVHEALDGPGVVS
jgi:hypothetical protein